MSKQQENKNTLGAQMEFIARITMPDGTVIEKKVSADGGIPSAEEMDLGSVDGFFLTSSLRTPKIFIKEFGDFLMSCHQHCLGVNLLVQR